MYPSVFISMQVGESLAFYRANFSTYNSHQLLI